MERAIVLISPGARRGAAAHLRPRLEAAISAALATRGFLVEFATPPSALAAAELLRSAPASGYALAVTAGGDGSVRLAVDALAGSGVPLGIVPLGTGNLLAATLGISRDPIKAAAKLASAQPVTIDTGLLTTPEVSESFAVAAGLGFDARLMAETSSALKSRLGVLAYFVTALRMLPALPAARTEIVVDGRHYELDAVVVFVANCGQILPGLMGPRALLDPTDGLLDVVVIRSGVFPQGLVVSGRSALDALLRGDTGTNGPSLRLRGADIKVLTDPPEPIQVDGDPLPGVSGSFRAVVRPASLTVLV